MKARNNLSSMFTLIGVISIILSVCCFMQAIGGNFDKEEKEHYGGDAYTGIQQATAQTATNVYYLTKIVANIGGGAFLISALTFFSASSYLNTSKEHKEKTESSTVKVENGEQNKDNNNLNTDNSNTAKEVKEVICAKCGYRIANGGRFCPKCGSMINNI